MKVLLLESASHPPINPLFLGPLMGLDSLGEIQALYLDDTPHTTPRWQSGVSRIGRRSQERPIGFGAYNRAVCEIGRQHRPNVALVVKGAWIHPGTLDELKRLGVTLVGLATDDPFAAARSNTRWVRQCIPKYHVYLTTRTAIIEDLYSAGANRVEYLPFAYKRGTHFAQAATGKDIETYDSDVVFIGGADEDRLPYFREVINTFPEIKLRLYGAAWERFPEFRPWFYGVVTGAEFRIAISSATICINLLRRSNRDGHVMRTFEVPACGGLLLTERSDEQSSIFREGAEMDCFETHEEMIDKIRYYLAHPERAKEVAQAGHERVTTDGHTYDDRLRSILNLVGDC